MSPCAAESPRAKMPPTQFDILEKNPGELAITEPLSARLLICQDTK